MNHLIEFIHDLIPALSALPGVRSIGKSGGVEIPVGSGSDIDIYVFCDQIPVEAERDTAARPFGDVAEVIHLGESKHWGVNDLHRAYGVEVFVMYHAIESTVAYVDSVLTGERPDREDGFFYPTGKCATLNNMGIFCDEGGFLAGI